MRCTSKSSMRVVFARGATLLPTPTRGEGGLQRGVRRAETAAFGAVRPSRETPLLPPTFLSQRLRRRTPGRSADGRNARRRRDPHARRDEGPETSSRISRREVRASRCAPGTDTINVDQSKRDEKKATKVFFWRFAFTKRFDRPFALVSSGERRNAFTHLKGSNEIKLKRSRRRRRP